MHQIAVGRVAPELASHDPLDIVGGVFALSANLRTIYIFQDLWYNLKQFSGIFDHYPGHGKLKNIVKKGKRPP